MVRTRFAPSPTGYLHIGGVRTALFNWLFARKHGGQFLLRIDDTDAERNVAEALQPILNGLRWVGIDWDEGPEVGGPCGPYYQSQKLDRYQQAVQTLLDRGHAYLDYSRPEEYEAEKQTAEKAKQDFIYSRRWLAVTPDDQARFEAEGRRAAVRLKMPREGQCRFHDLIRGDVAFDWAREPDHIIRRANGSFIYHLANVVDDFDMKITHVIRAEEHLSNTPRQRFIIEGLGYPMPEYAHLPYVAAPAGKDKLSKRKIPQYLKQQAFQKLYNHGKAIADRIGVTTSADTFNPVITDFYELVGYLSDTLVNYLLLLGWAYDDRKEEFTRQEMIDLFTLDKVNKAPASFDPDKLWAFQDRDMRKVPIADKIDRGLPYLQKAGLVTDLAPEEAGRKLAHIVEAAGDRIKVFGDVLDYPEFFQADVAFPYEEKAFEQRLRKPARARELLKKFRDRLAEAGAFDAASLEKLIQDFVEAEGIKLNEIIHAVRVAVTGKSIGFGMFETLEILGKTSCLARIDRALGQVEGQP
jgi:glutamyl-tRNA synthetase